MDIVHINSKDDYSKHEEMKFLEDEETKEKMESDTHFPSTSFKYSQHNLIYSKEKSSEICESKPGSVSNSNFVGKIKNDGSSGEFDNTKYSHSQEMMKVCIFKYTIARHIETYI